MKQQETSSQGLISFYVKMHFCGLTQRSSVLCVFPSSASSVAEAELESQSSHIFTHVLLITAVIGTGLLYVSKNNCVLKMSHEPVCFGYLLNPLLSLALHIYSF